MKRAIFIITFCLGTAAGSLYAQGSWTAFVTNLGGNPPQAASFLNENFGFVETGNNWYRTSDGGKSWVLTKGLGIHGLVHLNFFYNTPGDIIVNGAYESIDSGLTWKKLGNPTMNESIYELGNSLYDGDGRLSFDHGVSWQQIMGYSGGEAVIGNLDKGVAIWGGQTFGFPPGSTLFTTDGGFTWHIGQAGVESDFGYAFPFTLTYLRAGGDGKDAIERTTDGGATWNKVYNVAPNSWYFTDGIQGDGCVVFVQTDTTNLSPSGVLRSTDLGVTWAGIGGPTCTDDAPVCGVGARGAVCFAMDYFLNGKNTLWKYTDPALLHSVLNDLTIDRLFPDTLFMADCDTTQIKVRLHFSACDFIRFHGLWIDSLNAQNYISHFTQDNIIRTGFPDSGTITIIPNAPGTYHLRLHINVSGSDWSGADTTLPFILIVKPDTPALIVTPNDTINFGAAPICFSGGNDSLLLSNPSCEMLTVTQINFVSDTTGQSAYSVSMAVPYDIIRGSSRGKITILYHPKSAGIKTGKIIIVTTIGNDTIPVYGDALPDTAKLSVTKNTPINFGTQPLCASGGKDTVFLSDSNCILLRVTKILFQADSSPGSEFNVVTAAPFDLQFGKPAGKFILNFHPITSGLKTGKIIIETSIGNDTIFVHANILPDGRALAFNFDTVRSPICDSTIGLVMIHNLSCRQMSLDSLALLPPFEVLPKQLPVVINSGDSTILRLRFAPSLRGLQKITGIATLRIFLPSGSSVFDTTLTLIGIGLPGASAYSLSNSNIAFDTLSLCDSASQRITIYSIGCDSLKLKAISIFGDPDLQISGVGGKVLEIATGDSIVFNVLLNPSSLGNKSATITITLNDSSKVTLPVSAIIIRAQRILVETPGITIDFGMLLTCQNRDTLIILSNPSCDIIQVSGIGWQGSGFGTKATFPIILLPGESKKVDIFTSLDTSGGALSNSSQLTITSDANNVLAPITLTKGYIYPHPVHLWLSADPTPITSSSTWKVKMKGRPSELTDIRTIDLTIDYNADLLGYLSNLSSAKSPDGKIFHVTGSPVITAASDSTIADIAFAVYLTKDTLTTLIMKDITFNSSDVNFMGCVAIPQAAGLDFNYLNLCGDPSIRTFIRDGNLIRITSINPNPAQDELEINLQSVFKQEATIEILNALGAKVYLDTKDITSGANSIHLNTRSLSSGVYLVRVGAASQSFVKAK